MNKSKLQDNEDRDANPIHDPS